MKISVKNFGPIREAKDIKIEPMTLFVGRSNTGKSYLAVALYAVVQILTKRPMFRLFRTPQAMDLVKKVRQDPSYKISGKDSNALFSSWAMLMADAWKEKMFYCFGEEGKPLVQSMSATVSSDDGGIALNLAVPEKSRMSVKYRSMMAEKFAKVKRESSYDESSPETLQRFWMQLWRFCISELLWKPLPRISAPYLPKIPAPYPPKIPAPYYLPAVRGGIMQSHRMLVDAVMEQAPSAGLAGEHTRYPNSMPAFTGVLSDFMRNLIHLPGVGANKYYLAWRRGRPNAKIAAIGNRMESEIMKGNIQVKLSETGYPDYRYQFSKGEKRTLSLKNTSSMVSELAPVSIFIRYYLNDGDLFIVEEPEAHLHPGGQCAISEVLARLANAGVFVLATTHSDVVLEQISNFVHASQIKKAATAKIADDAVLTETQVVAYSFATGSKRGTVVKKVEFNPEYGVLPSDHLDESTKLYNQTVQLLNGRDD